MMNPRAPDYRAQPPATNVSKGSDLASLFSNLHTSSSPAAAATATPSVSTISPQKMQTHDQTLIRFVPASSGVNARAASSPGKSTDQELLERARSELHEQSQLLVHSKLLQLSDQVVDLFAQRAAFEERQAESEQVIKQLHAVVVNLRAQVGSHHTKLEACKQFIDERAREHRNLEQRVKELPVELEPKFQHQSTRLNKIDSQVRQVESQTMSQLKQHASQLSEHDQLLANKTDNNVQGSHAKVPQHEDPAVSQVKSTVNTLAETQSMHEKYLQQVGETLMTHQTGIDTANIAISGLRAKLETLSAVHARVQGSKEHQTDGRIFKMDPTASAIVHLQSQIDRMAKHTSVSDQSVNESERLTIQIDEMRQKIQNLEKHVETRDELQHHLDQCSLSSKIRLESMFYQLTKEYLNKCNPEDVEFGLDKDSTFMVRQRVLERLAVEDSVQMEFQRLKESQEMPR